MKHYTYLVFVFSLHLFPGFNTNACAGATIQAYYPLQEGNEWVYSAIEDSEFSNETYKVESKEVIGGIETVKIVLSPQKSDFILYLIDAEGIKIKKYADQDGYEIIDPPILSFPVDIETEGIREYVGTFNRYSLDGTLMSSNIFKLTTEFLGKEDVIVPAGIFQSCIKLHQTMEEERNDGGYSKNELDIWLALGVGVIKEHEFTEELHSVQTQEKVYHMTIRELSSAVIDSKATGN